MTRIPVAIGWCIVLVLACVIACVALPVCKAADAVAEIWNGGRQL